MQISNITDEFSTEFTKLIDGLSVIDENDPITTSRLKELKNLWKKYADQLLTIFIKTPKHQSEYKNKMTFFLNKYEQRIRVLGDSLNKTMRNITKDHIEACQKLKQKIEVAKKDANYSIEQFEVEFNYFLATSEQNCIILTNDFYEAKKRYDYQKEEAKDSYLEIVEKNNILLAEIKKHLKENYEKDLANLLETQKKEREKLARLVTLQEQELASITLALNNERGNTKEKYRQESANLNENIKRISEEKNRLIDKAKEQYNKSINNANIEKENKKAVYQVQSQALLKEFVTKINIIDENTTLLKKEFKKKTDQLKREYYTEIYEKTKVFHDQLTQIYGTITEKPDKYTRHLIHFKNKQHIASMHDAKKEKELILLELTKDNTVSILSNRNDKNFLEIDKNFSIKNLTDQEQFDNKFYQENDNIYENDYNYTIKSANYRFSQQANLLRCQSQIRTKLIERNFDGISANYYKKIESIQNKISAYKFNVEITERINQVVLKYLENAYYDNLHLEETLNLLEIEKNKLLKEYNQTQYENNIKNISLAKEYGFKKVDIENQRAEEEKNLKIVLENLILEKNCSSTTFSIKREELNERFAKIKTQIINNNDLKVSKNDYITSLLENDITYLEHFISQGKLFLEHNLAALVDSLNLCFKEVVITVKNYKYLNSFANSIIELFLKNFIQIYEAIYQEMIQTLDGKINYIFTFKYKTSLDSLEDSHLKEVALIKEKKTTVLDNIDSCHKTIENFRQKIFTLINDNEMLIHTNQLKKKKLDAQTHAAIKKTELKIKDYKEKIEDFTNMAAMHNEDVFELNKKLVLLNSQYKIEFRKIQKMVNQDIFIYLNYKDILERNLVDMQKRITSIRTNLLNVQNERQLLPSIKGYIKKIKALKEKAEKTLYDEFEEFKISADRDILKRKNISSKEFKNDIKKFNLEYNKSTLLYHTEYVEEMEKHEKKIDEQNTLIQQMMQLYDHRLYLANLSFQKDSAALDYLHQQKTFAFFQSYYALDKNHQEIIAFHQRHNLQKEEQYHKDNSNLNKENLTHMNLLNAKLKTFLKQKNEEIEHLPIAFKFNSKMLNRETKRKNIQLHEEMKEAKTTYNIQNKHIEKNIKSLKNHLVQDKISNELRQKKNIIKERKNNLIHLKESLRNIKIDL